MMVQPRFLVHRLAAIRLVVNARADQDLAPQFEAVSEIPAGKTGAQSEIVLQEHDIGIEGTDGFDDLFRIVSADYAVIGGMVFSYDDASDFMADISRETNHGREGDTIALDDKDFLFHFIFSGAGF
jgi:hypothetical protein